MSKIEEKQKLVESIGIDIEERLKLSPLAARIYALLILSNYDGLAFEEIRVFIGASKSSVSVNINVLTQLDYISFYTKPGDRRRYFKLTKYAQINSLSSYLQNIHKEMAIIEKINHFNKKEHPDKFINENSLGKIYELYLVEQKKLIEKTIQNFKNFLKETNENKKLN
jgi:DNA-binding transcriptional regulator GbsR (MarR family)